MDYKPLKLDGYFFLFRTPIGGILLSRETTHLHYDFIVIILVKKWLPDKGIYFLYLGGFYKRASHGNDKE